MTKDKIKNIKRGTIFYMSGNKKKLFICTRTRQPDIDKEYYGYILPYDEYLYMKGDPVLVKTNKRLSGNISFNFHVNFQGKYLDFNKDTHIITLDQNEVDLLEMRR
jgi:hypothetical protein